MSKLAVTILVFRVLQLGLGIAFLVFWSWAIAAQWVVGGGPGEYFFGYVALVASLAVCVHGIWSFGKRHHHTEHRALYHNVRWAIDLAVVCLWLGVILIEILVSVPQADKDRELNGPATNHLDASDPFLIVGLGVNVTQLFSAITFLMTALLLVIPAVKARRTKNTSKSNQKDETEGSAFGSSLQAPEPVHIPQHTREV